MGLRGLTSVAPGDDVRDVPLGQEGEVEDVGGVVLPGHGVHHLRVNSDLDVLPLGVTHLKIEGTVNTVCFDSSQISDFIY